MSCKLLTISPYHQPKHKLAQQPNHHTLQLYHRCIIIKLTNGIFLIYQKKVYCLFVCLYTKPSYSSKTLNVGICICVFVFVYLCICICVFVFVYLYLCICICLFVFVYLYVRKLACSAPLPCSHPAFTDLPPSSSIQCPHILIQVQPNYCTVKRQNGTVNVTHIVMENIFICVTQI